MSEVELVAAALGAGATAGLSETVQRGARDAWRRVFARAGRERGAAAGQEQPAGGPAPAAPPAGGPGRAGQGGQYTVVADRIGSLALGENSRQINEYHYH